MDSIKAAELGEMTGLTDIRHRQIAALGFFKQPYKGVYEYPGCIRGLFQYYRERSKSMADEMVEEKRRKLSAERSIKEQQAAKLEGSLVSVQEVSRVWALSIHTARTLLNSTRGKVTLLLAGKTGADPVEIEDMLSDRDKQFLCELHGGKWASQPMTDEELEADIKQIPNEGKTGRPKGAKDKSVRKPRSSPKRPSKKSSKKKKR